MLLAISGRSGNVTVIGPNAPTTNLAPQTSDVSVDIAWLAAPPPTVVFTRATQRRVHAGTVGRVTVCRRLTGRNRNRDRSVPLPILHTMGGTAVAGRDYDIVPAVAVIPPGRDEVEIPVRTRPSGRGTTVGLDSAASSLCAVRGATAETRFAVV